MTIAEGCAIFGTGLGAATLVLSVVKVWMARNERHALARFNSLENTTSSAMQKLIAAGHLAVVKELDPKSYFTLELEFPGGPKMRVPMVQGRPLGMLENITVEVTHVTSERTTATLVCNGFGHVDMHCHPTHHERIRVDAGTMTCLLTGRIFREGDVWDVPAGEMHGAHFQDAVLILHYTPPLPRASEHPVNVDAMQSLFPT